GGGVALAYQSGGKPAVVETKRVRVPEATEQANDLVALNATGYIMAAHKIELASKVIGRVAWVGVEMGDQVKKDQVLVRLEDDEGGDAEGANCSAEGDRGAIGRGVGADDAGSEQYGDLCPVGQHHPGAECRGWGICDDRVCGGSWGEGVCGVDCGSARSPGGI